MDTNRFVIFTDGSSRGNPGPGGYGAILLDEKNGQITEIGGHEEHTTNNRMELKAAIEALLMVRKISIAAEHKELFETVIHSDSTYVLNGITRWVKTWEKNNWMTGQNEGVLNQDLWQPLLELSRDREMRGGLVWKKVSGHAGVLGNERADIIATSFADQTSILLFSGTVADYEKMLGAELKDMTPKTTKKKTTSATKAKKTKGVAYSYVSMVNGELHLDKTWAVCEKRVKGVKGAKYQKAMTKEEEQDLIAKFSLESLVE